MIDFVIGQIVKTIRRPQRLFVIPVNLMRNSWQSWLAPDKRQPRLAPVRPRVVAPAEVPPPERAMPIEESDKRQPPLVTVRPWVVAPGEAPPPEQAMPIEEQFAAIKNMLAASDIQGALAAAANLPPLYDVWPIRWGGRFYDFSVEERLICAEARGMVVTTPESAVSLARAVRYVIENDIPGAFVECGVYLGGSVMIILRTLLLCGQTDREIYLFDTFEGMPAPDERDVSVTGEVMTVAWEQMKHSDGHGSDMCRCTLDEVRARILATGYPAERIHFVKGKVEDTVPTNAPEKIALLRLDTDWYISTKHELTHLYPRLSERGILIIDDYGALLGCRQATDEYLCENKLPIFLNRIDEHVRLAIKT